jgi:hypothetical protein
MKRLILSFCIALCSQLLMAQATRPVVIRSTPAPTGNQIVQYLSGRWQAVTNVTLTGPFTIAYATPVFHMRGTNDFQEITFGQTTIGGLIKGGFRTNLNTGNVDVGALTSGGYKLRFWSDGSSVAEFGTVNDKGRLTLSNDNSANLRLKPLTNSSQTLGIEFVDFANASLGGIRQNTGTGDMVLTTHYASGLYNVRFRYDNRNTEIRQPVFVGFGAGVVTSDASGVLTSVPEKPMWIKGLQSLGSAIKS